MAMQEHPRVITPSLLLGIFIGAAAGAVAVALTTPKTGREVRKTLRTAARRFTCGLEDDEELDNGTIDALFI